ncbi:MAG: hypothetical protein ACERIH_04665 [Labilibaculum antarcticum]
MQNILNFLSISPVFIAAFFIYKFSKKYEAKHQYYKRKDWFYAKIQLEFKKAIKNNSEAESFLKVKQLVLETSIISHHIYAKEIGYYHSVIAECSQNLYTALQEEYSYQKAISIFDSIIYAVGISYLSSKQVSELKIIQKKISQKATFFANKHGYQQQAFRYGFFYFFIGELISPNSTPEKPGEKWKEKIDYSGKSDINFLVKNPLYIAPKINKTGNNGNFKESAVKEKITEMINDFTGIEFEMGIKKIKQLCEEMKIELVESEKIEIQN